MKDYIYYPGCSLKGNSKHYEESILPVFKELGFPLEELEDWNCCGATAYFLWMILWLQLSVDVI